MRCLAKMWAADRSIVVGLPLTLGKNGILGPKISRPKLVVRALVKEAREDTKKLKLPLFSAYSCEKCPTTISKVGRKRGLRLYLYTGSKITSITDFVVLSPQAFSQKTSACKEQVGVGTWAHDSMNQNGQPETESIGKPLTST